MLIFKFPEEIDSELEEVASYENLREILRIRRSPTGFPTTFKFCRKNEQYIYAYCTRCSAKLRYKYDLDASSYKIVYSNLNHQHRNHRKLQFEAICQFIRSMPIEVDQKNLKHIIMSQYSINQSKFYYIYRKCIHPKLSYSESIKVLQDNECYIQSQPWTQNMNTLPQILIVVSPNMKYQYQQFGQWLYFDTTYHIIRDVHDSGKRWKVGMMIGLNSAKKIIPFGFCIVLEETKESFYKIFRSFFQIMGKTPNAVISDQSIAIKSALAQLKMDRQFLGEHLLDNFHIIKNIKKHLIEKDKIHFFIKLIRAKSLKKFQQLVEQSYQQINHEKDLQTFSKFIKNSHQYCFACIPSVFVGTSISDSPVQKANDLLKKKINIQRNFSTVVVNIFQFMEGLIQKSSNKFQIEKRIVQQYYCFGQIKYIRLILCKSIFKVLISQIRQIYLLELQKMGDRQWIVRDRDNLQFRVFYQEDQKLFTCSCHFYEKCGLPCMHLCKCIKINGESIQKYIHQRWKRQYIEKSNNQKRGRGRNSRRNRH